MEAVLCFMQQPSGSNHGYISRFVTIKTVTTDILLYTIYYDAFLQTLDINGMHQLMMLCLRLYL